LGAVFSVVFAGFSAESLAGRISDSSPKMVVTCSAVKRGPKHIHLKKIVDEALQILDNEEQVGSWWGAAGWACCVAFSLFLSCLGAKGRGYAWQLARTRLLFTRLLCGVAPQSLCWQVHVPRVLVYDHVASGVPRDAIAPSLVEGRDVWWQDVLSDQPTECEVAWVGAEDPLFKVWVGGWVGGGVVWCGGGGWGHGGTSAKEGTMAGTS
jgi:hypothetical protein